MSEARKVRDQAKRAKSTIKQVVELARRRGADIDVEKETERIRDHLKDPQQARRAGTISRHVVALADLLSRLQRPQDLLRTP